ncbi:MAG: PPE family protein, partial [Actinomycetota bacterium]|nr:PPE family protein [Actinomycetota bacterium]
MFGPPEVITGRLMSGAGSAPMLAASAQYTAAAVAYEASADRLMAQMVYLSSNWLGTTAQALQRTTARHLAWMRVLQAQLVLAASRTAAQAAAFTTAYTSMAQMPAIVENRVTTATLHATNFLGVNTIPIAVREGQYQAMWAQDVAVQTAYWAATVANTTFEPFVPATPIAGFTSFPPVITQALNAALAAGDSVRLAADNAAAMAGILKGKLGMVMGNAVDAGIQGKTMAKQAEAQAAVARYRENQLEQATQPAADQMTQQLVQQLPQQAAQIGQQVAQLPQQAVQQITQVGQQAGQFGSQIGNLMGQVSPEYRLDNPGFFDTHPSSSTLDRLA